MSELHLKGSLDLAGDLALAGKVFADGQEVLVALPMPVPPAHGVDAVLPPKSPSDLQGTFLWVTGSSNTTVKVDATLGAKAVVTMADWSYVQGMAPPTQGNSAVEDYSHDIKINGKPVVTVLEKVTLKDGNAVTLIYSGQ